MKFSWLEDRVIPSLMKSIVNKDLIFGRMYAALEEFFHWQHFGVVVILGVVFDLMFSLRARFFCIKVGFLAQKRCSRTF